MGAQDKADLRKEVDMNEHTDSIEDVAKQYKVSLEKGLSDSEVQEVINGSFDELLTYSMIRLIPKT